MRRARWLVLLVVLSCSRPPVPPAASAPEAVRRDLALAAVAGGSELERLLTRAQAGAREHPEQAERWVLLGQLWARRARASLDPGCYLSAQAAAEEALALQPGLSAATALRALVALNQHRFGEARDLALQALGRREDDLLALAALADAQLELGQPEAARAAVQRMLDLKPNLPAYGRAAHLRWLAGDAPGAAALYRLAVGAGNDPRDLEPQAWMLVQAALLYLDQGDLEGAEAGLELALRRVEAYPPALVGLAQVRLARGAFPEAAALLRRALAQSPLVDTQVLLAEALEAAGDRPGAEAAWAEAARRGRAGDPLALGRGWAEAGLHAGEAAALLRAEAEARPGGPVLAALAWAEFRLGDLAAARAASVRAQAAGAPDVRARFQHAAILAALGERAAAGEALAGLAPRLVALPPPLAAEAAALVRSLASPRAAR